jgi:hypothetical protein
MVIIKFQMDIRDNKKKKLTLLFIAFYLDFFFVFNGFHVLYTFYMAVGIPST